MDGRERKGEGGVAGTLTLVATPIGNLGDMTFRGVEVLREADLVLAEDTRRTRKLFRHYGIERPMLSYHDHNKEVRTAGVLARLRAGEKIALVTDAGTPAVSDPGYYLVREALKAGIEVRVVPGPNAILPALVLSGFPTDAFVFEGFLPRKKGQLKLRLEELVAERRTSIFFVSPHRLMPVLELAAEVLPERMLAVVREMTKLHEEVARGRAGELLARFRGKKVRGEVVLVVAGSGRKRRN